MIQIYDQGNTNYSQNGNAILMPTVCELEAELNGGWCIVLEHPLDQEGRWKHIVEDAVIQCDTFLPKPQRFRIYEKQKGMTGVIAFARPVFLDTKDTLILDSRPTEKTGQEALDILLDESGFKGKSNISKRSTSYFVRKNIPAALLGDDENSFVNRWGGEVIYDNETVIINDAAGGDYGVRCEFGKNLGAITETVNMDSVITRIVPVSFNGYTLSGDTPWVDSPNIGKYATVHMKEVQFRDIALAEDMEGGYVTLEELQEALADAATRMYTEQSVDLPAINYEVDMVELSRTVEYRNYKILETVGLGDTVHCRHKALGIEITSRVIRLVYDCILGKNKEVELGDYKGNYFNGLSKTERKIDKAISSDGSVHAECIQGIINATKTTMRAQKSVAKTQQVRAILFEDLDPSSETYGAMCLGTMGFQIASERTADGKDWDWRTFGTGRGFFADWLVAGVLQGVEIIVETGIVGGWKISKQAIYKDVVDPDNNSVVHRVCFQPPLDGYSGKTQILSCQKSTDSGKSFTENFILYSDGSARFGDTLINADGTAWFGDLHILEDGTLLWVDSETGEYYAQIVRQSNGGMSIHADSVWAKSVGSDNGYSGDIYLYDQGGNPICLTFENGLLSANSKV
ncbi:MAG: phage tail protein [Lachnospiraceae bacterium]|nr:phage tail protein [Lachnospiraceae bacterium]